jgi:ubiquinone/menaquinone biosynthesis C-methylase UbiE
MFFARNLLINVVTSQSSMTLITPENVRDFYNSFNFEEMISQKAPKLIVEFIDQELEKIQSLQTENSKVIEIGCGYGRNLSYFSRAKEVVGIDFSQEMILQAKSTNSVAEFYLMDARKTSFEDDYFDWSFCLNNTLGNMPGIEQKVISEMHRITKPKGKIVLCVFSEEALESQLENYRRLGMNVEYNGHAVFSRKDGWYSRRFSEKELVDLVVPCGRISSLEKLCPINYFLILEVLK